MSISDNVKSSLAVAKWEFGRYCKLRDQLIGMLSLLIGGFVGISSVKISQSNSEVRVVTNAAQVLQNLPDDSQIRVSEVAEPADALRQRVMDKEYDAALIPTPGQAHDWELMVRSEPVWLDQLQLPLNQQKSASAMVSEGINAESIAKVFTPANIQVTNLLPNPGNKMDRVLAFSILAMVILTSWLGLAYMLTGISGEKQQRVTEQIVSAISAQAWIDGKLLGITAASFASTANLVVTGLLAVWVGSWFGFSLPIPSSLGSIPVILWITFYCVASAFLWNCFYAAVATVINDPNTSARSSLMFLPVLPMATAAVAMARPDGAWMRLLSIVPGSSATAMPIRLLLGQVAVWELAVSFVLLVLAIVTLRTIAGRVFRAGILLTGKEPSWLEIVKWSLATR